MTNSTAKERKPKKPLGPIRTGVVVPTIIVVTLVWAYFFFLFDRHLRQGLEYAGYQVFGAETNISRLKTSFWEASFEMYGLEVTDAGKPSTNLFSISEVRFKTLWDGLLRARFVVDEMRITQIEYGGPRVHPGRVKPPDPRPPKSDEPSALEKEAKSLAKDTLSSLEDSQSENFVGNLAQLLGGQKADDILKGLQGELKAESLIKETDQVIKTKQAEWEQKIKSLPSSKELEDFKVRLGQIKTSDFKNLDEVNKSIQAANSLKSDYEGKAKGIADLSQAIETDTKFLESRSKEIEAAVKSDMAAIEKKAKLPNFDAKAISKYFLGRYVGKYIAQFNHYKSLAEKYLPPNLLKKKDQSSDVQIKAHPRARGITYEFGRKKDYPLFWIKKIQVSSQAGSSVYSGNIDGLVTNITSNQELIGSPTKATWKGNFPQAKLMAFVGDLTLDFIGDGSLITLNNNIGQYAGDAMALADSPQAHIGWSKSKGSMKLNAVLTNYSQIKINAKNVYTDLQYDIRAENPEVGKILSQAFATIPAIDLNISAEGKLPDPAVSLTSNLGGELERSFRAQLEAKLKEIQGQIRGEIDRKIGSEKAKIESQIAGFKSNYEDQVNRVRGQVDSQKKEAEGKVDASKKDFENKANQEKKKAETEGRKKFEEEARKKAEELRKKLGF